VPEDQLSLAIGKQGQNVRLAAKLTGWNIDIISADESHVEAVAAAATAPAPAAGRRRDFEGSLLAAIDEVSGDAAEPVVGDPAEGIDPEMDEEATGAQTDALSGQAPVDEDPTA
jgi:hypothetical protein